MYQACSGRAWTPTKGSKASHITTASQISALDFLRARAEKRRDRYEPQGPVVVVSGPTDWHDWEIIWNRLDVIHARIPHMALVTTGQRTGVDASAASWAARNGVFCISFDLQGRGKGKKRASTATGTFWTCCQSRRSFAKGPASRIIYTNCSTPSRADGACPRMSSCAPGQKAATPLPKTRRRFAA
jgi:hypothetical protein